MYKGLGNWVYSERFSQPSKLDRKAWGVAALTASVGASFQRRIAEGKND